MDTAGKPNILDDLNLYITTLGRQATPWACYLQVNSAQNIMSQLHWAKNRFQTIFHKIFQPAQFYNSPLN